MSARPVDGATAGEGGRKLRDACNHCSAQKIRCGKERPSCARCASRGFECHYGVSMRTGRPPQCATNNTGRRSTSPRTRTEALKPRAEVPDTARLSMQATGPIQADAEAAHAEIGDQEAFVEIVDEEMDSLFSLTGSHPKSFANMHLPAPDKSSMKTAELTYVAEVSRPGGMGRSIEGTTLSSSKALAAASESGNRSAAGDPHQLCPRNCMASLFQRTIEMHVPRHACTAVLSTPRAETRPEEQDARDVDAVLCRNREAIEALNCSLDCPCSAEPSVTLAAYLLASKVILWYSAILEIDVAATTAGEHNAVASCIISRPIFMGNWSLDAGAHRAVRARIVQSELCTHVKPVINRLPLFHSSVDDAAGQNAPVSSSPTLHQQRCVLRRQFRRAVTAASLANDRPDRAFSDKDTDIVDM